MKYPVDTGSNKIVIIFVIQLKLCGLIKLYDLRLYSTFYCEVKPGRRNKEVEPENNLIELYSICYSQSPVHVPVIPPNIFSGCWNHQGEAQCGGWASQRQRSVYPALYSQNFYPSSPFTVSGLTQARLYLSPEISPLKLN